jgi:DNA-binding transcriptional MerR regulator
MRMAELSAESGIPVATIKYYLREGLLPPGERTSPNQARYAEIHVRRLKLVRALMDVGGLSISQVGAVLEAIDEQEPTHDLLGVAHHGLKVPKGTVDDEGRAWAMARIDRIAEERKWAVKPEDKVVEALVGVLCTFRELDRVQFLDGLGHYAELAAQMAQRDLALVGAMPTAESLVETAIIGTVLGEALFIVLRRLAHQNASAELFGSSDER